ncbi:hypothetical protein POVWA2_022020 [Plasmodium ovale wallikeri]|uniref:Uncharacterized protein n=1 Tax=Plasmodium ovale wallikeri TaxID=864142 RepID=A0A1A8YRZ5_PLAOA|nr:hypothetical protein POVWA1_022200 [Plasmodium ovale wallikeri]SBT34863.1 hypothetical protein POVWA2_022020 [Plasmodium ovale wallikeri]
MNSKRGIRGRGTFLLLPTFHPHTQTQSFWNSHIRGVFSDGREREKGKGEKEKFRHPPLKSTCIHSTADKRSYTFLR